jgi:hypothetical protein
MNPGITILNLTTWHQRSMCFGVVRDYWANPGGSICM